MPIDYGEVLADLRVRRTMLDGLIENIEQLMGSEEKPKATQKHRPARAVRARKGIARKKVVNRRQNSTKKTRAKAAASQATQQTPSISISDVIRQAIKERPRTAVEVADRVEEVLPNTNRNSVSTIICQLVKSGEFRKNEQLQLRPSTNGAHA